MGFLKLIVHFFFCVQLSWVVRGGCGRGNRSMGGGWELQWCGPEGWRRVVPEGGPKQRRSGGPERVGRRKVGGPEGWGARTWKGWSPERAGPPKGGEAQNFALFLSLSRHRFALFVSLWGSSRGNFGGVWKRRGRQMCTFGVLGLSCEAPAAPKPRGFHTTARSLETAETIADCCISEFAKARGYLESTADWPVTCWSSTLLH